MVIWLMIGLWVFMQIVGLTIQDVAEITAEVIKQGGI